MFPIIVTKVSLEHRQETKAYHLVMMIGDDGKSAVLTRWGKIGRWGSEKVDTFDSAREASDFYESKISQKQGRGYSFKGAADTRATEDLVDFKKTLGPSTWLKLGKDAVNHLGLDELADVVAEPEEKKYEKQADGSFAKVTRPPRVPPPAPPVPAAERYAADTEWGEF